MEYKILNKKDRTKDRTFIFTNFITLAEEERFELSEPFQAQQFSRLSY